MPTDRSTRAARHEQSRTARTRSGAPNPRSGNKGDQAFSSVPGKGLVHFVKGDSAWKEMSSSQEDFVGGRGLSAISVSGGGQAGAGATAGTGLTKLIDSAATPGSGGQYNGIPSGHVNLIADNGLGGDTATIYNVKSGNDNLTIEDDEDGSGNSFILFTAIDQSVSLHRFDTVYTYNSGDENKDTAAADGADGIAFVDTANTTWTAVAPAGSGAYTNKAKVSLVTANDNTTYSTNASTVSGGANFNLLAANPTSTDALKFAGTGATTVTRTDASTITISSSAGVTSIIDANDPGGASYKSLVVSGSAGVAELIKVKGSGSTSVSVTTQGDPVEYFLDISSSQRGIDDTPVDNQTAESISSNWAYDHENHATLHDNFYLTGVTKSSNTLTFAVSGASNPTYTFGSNAFNSTNFLTAASDANDPGGTSYKSLIISGGQGGDLELIKVKGTGSTTVTSNTQGDPVEYWLEINSSQRGIDDTPVNNQTAESISSNWAYDHENHSTMHDNFYLTGVTKSSNTLTFAISGADPNPTYTFGSNAFNSTAFLSSIVPSAASGTNLESMVDDGSGGRIYSIKGGTGITVSIEGSESADYLEIASTVDTSGLLTNGLVIVEDWNGSEVEETASASGGDKLRFVENDGIEWSISGPTSNVISVTPSLDLSGYSQTGHTHSYISTGHAANSVTSTHITVLGNTSGTNSGNVCTSNHTGAGYLTSSHTSNASAHHTKYTDSNAVSAINATSSITTTCDSPDVNHNTDINWDCGTISGTAANARTTIGLASDDDVQFDSFGVGVAASGNAGEVRIANSLYINGYSGNTASRIRFHHNNTNAYQDWETGNYYIRYDESTKFMYDSSGNFHADADVYAYSTSVGSDKKLKKNIKDIKYGLSDVLKLRGVDFDWKEKRDGVHDIGVIAQEVREVIPEVVKEVEDVNGEKYLSVDYSKLVPVLIESIKELKEELDGIRKSR